MSTKDHQARLEASRTQLQHQINDLRRAVDLEFGRAPSLKSWGVPILAFAGGLALAAGTFARRRRKRLRGK